MYLKRKIDLDLDLWLEKHNRAPKLVVGIRQCSKTESIREFANRNNLDLIEINFWTHPEHYGKTKLIKIGDYNISENGDIITIPHYLTFVLGKIGYDS
ncbi:hypothetical protein DYE49_02280 [Treponema rectale]|uniref:AAA domain-containing protein n=1 Tax=Treponema rectale TaxID=744512 RepID=A0A7M1XIF3_9SPIR|nr:hypothetical protein DYE49_02280 [Treponema rectale]